MRVRRTENSGDFTIEVMVEDWQKDDESQEVFEERMVMLTKRLTTLSSELAEEPEGD